MSVAHQHKGKNGFFSLKKRQKKLVPQHRKIGDWILGQTLGMGGYSKVKLGTNSETGQKAALKIMFADSDTGEMSASKKKQLVRELQVMRKVKHKNVVQLIEYDECGEYPESDGSATPCIVVVLEYASAGELFDYLMFTGRFDSKATRTYFHQLVDGLEAIHQQGIAHRDLKPENLLLDTQCNLKIADFGFATEFQTEDGQEKKMQTACGTKGYLAPELLKGKKYNQKCDVFAVGIIMFTTFAGFPPFQNAVDSDWWWDKLSKGWKYLEQAKRIVDPNDVKKHVHAGKAKKELFWKAHERSVLFEPDFKWLMECTLHPLPSYRYHLKDIRKDKWFNGQTYSSLELQKYLTDRMDKVRKERVTKIERQLQEQPENNSLVIRPTRPLAPGAESRQDKVTAWLMKQAEKLDPKDDFMENLEFEDDHPIQTAYMIQTIEEPKLVAARIQFVAQQAGMGFSVDPAKNMSMVAANIKFAGNDGVSLEEKVQFSIKSYAAAEKEQPQNGDVQYKVCFKRLQGSHQAYRRAAELFLAHPMIGLLGDD